MTRISAKALAVAHPIIQFLTALNVLYAVGMSGLLAYSFFAADWLVELGFVPAGAHPSLRLGLRAIMVVGVVCAVIAHTILRRLLAIVDTVHVGDPFILENARRLHMIAWSVTAIEGLRLIVGTIAATVWQSGNIEMFTITPWLAVLLLFVLSGVFARGAQMRADLEGTV